jgi:outer membrane protein assembly factor BamB
MWYRVLADEEIPAMRLNSTPDWYEITLNWCQAPPTVPLVTTVAPVRERQSLYVSTGACLYAVAAADGTARWCQQVTLTWGPLTREQLAREEREHPMMSRPPLPRVGFAAPRVVGGVTGVVYVCVDGYGEWSYTCAFNADDGALRWWTPTDARVVATAFIDWAVPLVNDGKDRVVYSGTYALNAQDGAVLWRTAINTREEGTLALHALADETIYASTQRGIYAINAQDGQIRWLYQPDEQTSVSGPPVVSGRLLYAGTGGSVRNPEKSYFFALDGATGTEVWRSPNPMSSYIGAVVHDETIYVSSGDRTLSALETQSGLPRLRWQHQFASSGSDPATIANDVLYINITSAGAYALRSENGTVLWRQPLESDLDRAVSFTPSVVLDGAVYLVRIDRRGRGVLYALDARTGAECWRWHPSPPSAIGPLAVAQ